MSIFTPFIAPILEIINKVIPDPQEAQRIANALQVAAMDSDAKMIESQSSVIVAEAQGESWMQRNWRPSLMFLLMGVIVWHAVFVPILAYALEVALTDMVGLSVVPGQVWTLLTVGMGGYIGGRTLEKITDRVMKG